MTAVLLRGTIRIEGGPPQNCTVQADASVLTIWGGVPPAYVDIGGPAPQPHPDHGLPGQPPGFWGGRPPAYVDIGGPAPQPHPEHPIVIVPPGAIDGVHPEHPIFLPVYPAHPIELPPTEPAPEGFTWVYSPVYGWVADPNASGGKPVPIHPR